MKWSFDRGLHDEKLNLCFLNPIRHGGGGTKCPDQFLFAIVLLFLVGNMPLNVLTFLKHQWKNIWQNLN